MEAQDQEDLGLREEKQLIHTPELMFCHVDGKLEVC